MSESITTADHGHGHADRPKHLQHHFVTSDQQFEASKMGMWLFLITEILLFSGMFVAYAVYRTWYPEVFQDVSGLLDWKLGGLNTIVLLGSSFTVAMSIHYAQTNNKKGLVLNLALTILCACVFLVVKYFEYTGKFSHGIFAGAAYHPHGDYAIYDIAHAPQFFSIYFIMTGIHGVHVLIGIGVFIWILRRAIRGDFDSTYYTPVELTGLYWHLVDIIWIFLFPLLYLI